MHQAIAAWLTERPWRAALAAAICGTFSLQMLMPFMVLAGAIPVLVALKVESKQALVAAATAAAAAIWIVVSLAPDASWLIAGVLILIFGPVLLALLLKQTGSLNLCFQVAVAAVAVAVLGVHLGLPDPASVWVELLKRVIESMESAGLHFAGDTDAMIAIWSRTMWGALAALTLATLLGALFLGCWWQTLLDSPGRFGAEYRQLRLGRVLGLAVTALFVAAFLSDSALIASLAWVAFTALSFQGLAAAHRSKAGGRLNRGWLAAIYVLLIVPLSMSITVLVLAIWGFADNWLRPRTQTV
ncbi:MAG TPA: hypothetical protein PKE27_02515 [Povalibacter sp.]|uniref:hypothetical protein n=1 Tax=Povalibacter sp. TaxID=1962978 RepID=UPI002BD1781E|nr:hypothetical protein [Povalibacter sp.]HMN43415.1 hypothetical protein [Povalibacter sp.]